MTGDFNDHNYWWGSLNNDNRGDIVESFTDKKSVHPQKWFPRIPKPKAKHSQNPTSAIALSICTPDLGPRWAWESFLTHMLVTTAQVWHLCLPLLEVILTTGCSQNLTGSNSLSYVWIRLQAISSKTKTPSLCWAYHQCCKKQHPKGNHSPLKSNPWFDEECREMLRARRVLAQIICWRDAPRSERLTSFRRTQAQAWWLFTQKKRESWTKYAPKLNTDTPIKQVWDRVRKISYKNVCPPKW